MAQILPQAAGVTLWTFETGVGSGVALRFERVAAGCVKLAATMQAVGLGVEPTVRLAAGRASASRSASVRYAAPVRARSRQPSKYLVSCGFDRITSWQDV